MGRRSRKRAAEGASTRAERDAARRERARSAAGTGAPRRAPRPGRPDPSDRPPAPWGRAPLGELTTLIGIVVMVWGLVTHVNVRVGVGLLLAALSGLELVLREHLAGFRSHTSILSGVAAFIVVTILALGPGPHVLGVLVIIGVVAFAGAFYGFRELFKARSGGVGYR